MVVAPGLYSDETAAIVRDVARDCHSACFFGDLDPFDLWTFLSLTRSSVARRALPTVSWAGVDDEWLSRVRYWDTHNSVGRAPVAAIRLAPGERRRLDELADCGVDVAKIVGERAAHFLQRGYKLELEGALLLGESRPATRAIAWLRQRLLGTPRSPTSRQR